MASVFTLSRRLAQNSRAYGFNWKRGVDLRFHRLNQEMPIHTFASRSPFDDDRKERHRKSAHSRIQVSEYHMSTADGRAATIILGFGALAAVSYAGAQGVKAYQSFKSSMAEATTEEKSTKDDMETEHKEEVKDDASSQEEENQSSSSATGSSADKRENVFKEWFGVGVGSKYYEGGFEDTMTRREAALILGVRESSSAARIKEAHRKLLILNHPDTGGSTYMSGKINEAKELLMKGK